MTWSKETLRRLAPVLAAGKVESIGNIERDVNAEQLPKPLREVATSASKAFRRGADGLPMPDAIGRLPLSGIVTGTQKILKLFS